MRVFVHRFVGVILAVAVSGGIYWLVDDIGLTIVTGITWGISLILLLRISRVYPSHTTGTAWRDKRWTGLSTGVVTLAALVGVSPTLPIGADLRLALGFLVIGTGSVGYMAATLAELERECGS